MNKDEIIHLIKNNPYKWNEYRKSIGKKRIILNNTDFSNLELKSINFSYCDLSDSNFYNSILNELTFKSTKLKNCQFFKSKIVKTNFSEVNLTGSNFKSSYFRKNQFSSTLLKNTTFEKANILRTLFLTSNLSNTNFKYSIISNSTFDHSNLSKSDFQSSTISRTIIKDSKIEFLDVNNSTFSKVLFYNLTLHNLINMDKINFMGKSSIDEVTLSKNHNLSDSFLRGFGLPEWRIEINKLYNTKINNSETEAIAKIAVEKRMNSNFQLRDIFISYSQIDELFVKEIESFFDIQEIRYWKDKKNSTSGKIKEVIENAMNESIILIVLSENSIKSKWCKWEIGKAIELEIKNNNVICPISIDNEWESDKWPKNLRDYITDFSIIDFSNWKDKKIKKGQLRKLQIGLKKIYF